MRRFMKFTGVFLVIAVISLFTACDLIGGGDDDGGSGADFDDTLYYTKTEIDGLIADAVTESKSYADDLHSTISPLEGDGPSKTVLGLFNSANTLYWTVPEEATIGVFKVVVSTISATTPKNLIFGPVDESELASYPLTHQYQTFTAVVPCHTVGSLFAWTDDMAEDTTLSVTCLYWID